MDNTPNKNTNEDKIIETYDKVEKEKYSIFIVDGGIGKSIMATALLPSFNETYSDRKLVVVSAYPEVFLNNPNVYRIYKAGNVPYFYEDYIKDKDVKIFKTEPYQTEDFILQKDHLINIWAKMFGLNYNQITHQPKIYLTQREILFAENKLNKQGPILIVQANGGVINNPIKYSWARDIPFPIAQKVIENVYSQFSKVYQIRRDDQIPLKFAEQLTGNLRELFSCIALSDKFLCMDSFVQHAVKAFEKTAVVTWVANKPEVFGYNEHINVVAKADKSSFRHNIDSFLEQHSWTGERFYECPFDNLESLFGVEYLTDCLVGTK